MDPIDLLLHFAGGVKQTCQIVLCVHDNLWEFWSPSFLSSVTCFSTFASREQSLTIGIEKSLISIFILTDLKDINVRFFCSRFWELVVTRYADVTLCVFFIVRRLSQILSWIDLPTRHRTRLLDCPSSSPKSFDSFYSSDIFSAIVFCGLAIWTQLLTLPIEKSLTSRGFEFFSNRKSAILFYWHFWW